MVGCCPYPPYIFFQRKIKSSKRAPPLFFQRFYICPRNSPHPPQYLQLSLDYTILYYTILHYSQLYPTILLYTILYYSILFYTRLYFTIRFYTRLYQTTPDYTRSYPTLLYYTRPTILLRTVLDNTNVTILYNTILY